MKKIYDLISSRIGKITTGVSLFLLLFSQYDTIVDRFKSKPDQYVDQIDHFISTSEVVNAEVRYNDAGIPMLYVDYSTRNWPNCDYTSKYILISNKDFLNRIIIDNKDDVKKGQFWGADGVFYSDVTTNWRGTGIPLPSDVEKGSHELQVIMDFKCSKSQIKFRPQAILTIRFTTV